MSGSRCRGEGRVRDHYIMVWLFPSGQQQNRSSGMLEGSPTSLYFPFLPKKFLIWRTSALPSSSSMRLVQSSLPVDISTCSAYVGMEPLMPCSRSMSRPGGVSLHWHVGAGQLSIVGTGGGAKGISMREA